MVRMTSGKSHFGHGGGHGNVNWAVYAVFVVVLIVIFLLICEISRRHRKHRRRYISKFLITILLILSNIFVIVLKINAINFVMI